MAANDRAIQFGDGCFTTARIQQGQVALLDAHLQRLQTTCEKLHIPFNDWLTLSEEMQRLARLHAQGVLKVTLTRGVGGKGKYRRQAACRPLAFSASLHSRRIMRAGGGGHYSDPESGAPGAQLLACRPVHLNRLEQVLIRSHLEQTDADEALVLDSDGWLTECCAANLFWRQGRDVFDSATRLCRGQRHYAAALYRAAGTIDVSRCRSDSVLIHCGRPMKC